jgi:putative endonuclease
VARTDVWLAGERAAWETYRRRGFRLLARNWRAALGELDLVVAGDGLIVFCEVKARRSGPGAPFEAVSPAKQRKVRTLAEVFLETHRLGASRCRFDVASVSVSARGSPDVHVFEDAF